MPKEKMINARLQQKHDLEKNWMLAENFIPKIGELIVYDAETSFEDITDKNGDLIKDYMCEYARLKIGDGVTTVNNLAFVDDNLREELAEYALKQEQAAIKGKGLDSTQLHTGPVQAFGKYQVVAGMYNEIDPVVLPKIRIGSFMLPMGGSHPHSDSSNFVFITEPIFDQSNYVFKATISSIDGDWTKDVNYIERKDYILGEEVTFTRYYTYKSVSERGTTEIITYEQNLGKYAVIVGNGSSEDQRSNAYTLDWDGNGRYAGKIYVNNGLEQVAKLNEVPHLSREEVFSTVEPVVFSVKNNYLEYNTPVYIKGTEPFEHFEYGKIYCVGIDNKEYEVVAGVNTRLATVETESNLVNEGDFIFQIWRHVSSSSPQDKIGMQILLPGSTEEEHLITITKVNKSMVPEEIIPETIARKTDIQSFIINFTPVAPYCDKTIQEIAEAYNNNQNIEAYMIDSEVGKIHLSFAYTDANVTAITPWIYSSGNAKSCQFVYDETNSEWLYNPILLSESLIIDYESTLAFDTSEIVIGQSTTSILGQAILGRMILG